MPLRLRRGSRSASSAPPSPHKDVPPLSHGDAPPWLRKDANLDRVEHLMFEMIRVLQYIASANVAPIRQGLPLERL
ncbi:hypothetical protein GOBAR_AA07392 [Gossypium barbadense]|uniref:Uncharacterized protein n=1 Tax=Gossypium barbadense TaxID=3634 RepID=A0A2P5YCI6_GOSBA|nr:hypothetical protein GOBAR_AA07392 [Gossypium barbadense]